MADISEEMAKELPKAGFSGEEFNNIAKSSVLKGIQLLSSKFDYSLAAENADGKLKLNYGGHATACAYVPEEEAVSAIFEFKVEGKKGRKRVFHLVVEYGVSYSIASGLNPAAAEGYCKNVGRFAAYPYFRALAAHLFADADLRVPPLPAIASVAHIQKDKPSDDDGSE